MTDSPAKTAVARPDRATFLLSGALISLVLTQRLALPLGAFQLPVAVPAVFLFIVWGLMRGDLLIGRTRLWL